MDGKVMLLLCIGILGGAYFLGAEDISLGKSGGPSKSPKASNFVVDLRHNEIAHTLRSEGYDLNDPASYVRERDGIEVVGGAVAATEHGAPVFIKNVVAGYHRPVLSERPGKVSSATAVQACRFSAPEPGSRVANVFSDATLHHTSLYALSAAELEALAKARLETVRAEGQPESGIAAFTAKIEGGNDTGGADPYRYSVMELAVTETDVPVHLVLQTGTGRVLWNLHLAKGAEISGVSLLGGTLPAVANLPKGVPVEVLDAGAMAECDVTPIRRPLLSDPIFQDVDRGALPEAKARQGLEERGARVEAWNNWFAGQFGLRSDQTRIGYGEANVMAVVGGLPLTDEGHVPHHTLKRARVVMAEAEHVVVKDPGAAAKKIKSLIEERATELAGGDLALVAANTN